MADSTAAEQVTESANDSQAKTFTQEQVNAIVAERLSRAKSQPPADYEELKAKAAEYDAAQEAAKSDLQKAVERAEKAEKALNERKAADERRAKAAEAAKAAKLPGQFAAIVMAMEGDAGENAKAVAAAIESLGGAQYRQTRDRGEAPRGADAMHDAARMLFGGKN